MLMNEKQKEFLVKRVIEGKSYKTISKDLNVASETLHEWADQFMEEIVELRQDYLDQIIEEHKLARTMRIKYLATLYSRLTEELEKRDFSGLPTDKLYNMITSVTGKLDEALAWDDTSWDDFEDYDDYDDFDWEDE